LPEQVVTVSSLSKTHAMPGWRAGWLVGPQTLVRHAEALAIARQLDDPALLVRALTACCGTTAFDAEQAATYFAEAIELARALGDKWRLSRLLGFQAYAAAVTGDAKAALAAGEEGRELADAIGDQFSSFQCRVWGIAAGRAGLGDLPGADAEYREMLADANAAGDSLVRFHVLMTQSFALGWQGKTAAARAAAEAAIESAAELGLVVNIGHDLNLENLPPLIDALPAVAEASIGHELTADALVMGFAKAVQAYKAALSSTTAA